jgi:hypothetical protein
MTMSHVGLRALGVIALGTLAVVAQPSAGRAGSRTADPAGTTADSRSIPLQGGTIIQVRDFPSSNTVYVVAWSAAEPAFGLSTDVRRTGAPNRYHRLWVSIDWPGGRDATQAQGLDRPLQVSTTTETQNCFNGTCTPGTTFGARIPDGPFRASKDPLVVKFITGSGSEINFTARRALVDAYLATVDSVVAALKK